MTFKADLFQLTDGSRVWRYTSSAEAEDGPATDLDGSATYTTTTISRGSTKVDGQDVSVNNLSVFLGNETDLSQAALAREFQNLRLTLTVLTKYDDDYLVVWKGRLSVIKPRDADVEFTFESNITSERRHTLKMVWSRECPHRLYDANCRALKADHKVTLDVVGPVDSAMTTWEFTSGDIDPDEFPQLFLGMGTLTDDSAPHTILDAQDGGSVGILQFKTPWDISVETEIFAYKGCDKLIATCKDTFDNVLNFGGFPLIPAKNPHSGRID